jgi:hypothetical protein
MIQRIQTVYLLLAAIALIVLTLGVDVYSYEIRKDSAGEFITHVNSYGIQIDGELDNQISDQDYNQLKTFLKFKERTSRFSGYAFSSFPYFIFSLFLTMLVISTIVLYKKPASQLRIGRLAFVISLSVFVVSLIMYYSMKAQFAGLLDGAEMKSYLGLGFYMILVATAFIFLANIGIKRDINLLKSIDRIR